MGDSSDDECYQGYSDEQRDDYDNESEQDEYEGCDDYDWEDPAADHQECDEFPIDDLSSDTYYHDNDSNNCDQHHLLEQPFVEEEEGHAR